LTGVGKYKYTNDKLQVQQDIMKKLDSAGRRGRGEILRMSLAILTYFNGPRDVQDVRGDDGIEIFFESLFHDISDSYFDAYNPIHETYSSDLAKQFFQYATLRSDYRKAGGLFWNECVISTKGSEVRYSGPYLCMSYQHSAAQEMVQRGDIDGALKLYEKLVVEKAQSDDFTADEWDSILDISALTSNFDFAIGVAELVLATNSTTGRGWSLLLSVYQIQGHLQEAVERLKLAVEERHVGSFQALSDAYGLLGDIVNAVETLETAINHDPLSASIYWTHIGNIYYSHQDHNNASHAYEKAIALSQEPAPGHLHSSLGGCYGAQGRFRDAIVQLECGLRRYANEHMFCEKTFRCLTTIYTATGGYDSAIITLKSAIVRYPMEPSLKSLLGEVLAEVSDYNAAIMAYEAAIKEGHENPGHLFELIGYAKECKGELRGAIEAYEMAVEIDPADQECLEKLEELYEAIGDEGRVPAARGRKEAN
jgi:tetratricopeptide (TPR) repeat protein